MPDFDPDIRRNLRYAALPGKVATGFFVFLLCLFAGVFGMAVAAYLYVRLLCLIRRLPDGC
jgi:hypothetical protein